MERMVQPTLAVIDFGNTTAASVMISEHNEVGTNGSTYPGPSCFSNSCGSSKLVMTMLTSRLTVPGVSVSEVSNGAQPMPLHDSSAIASSRNSTSRTSLRHLMSPSLTSPKVSKVVHNCCTSDGAA